ncbi:MAG: methyltransferase domain-containing protein [Gemmatimonadota bacterium]|nr:methyltransferase domain-containing protein [Gemmatimonadota bacterium]
MRGKNGMNGVNKKILALHFSKSAGNYEALAGLQREIAFQLVEWAYKDGNKPIGMRRDNSIEMVLDLGCGTGFLTGFLEKVIQPESFVALDLAHGMLEEARANGPQLGVPAGFIRADGEKLPFAPGSFDLVASSTAFQWFSSLEESLADIYEVLRPGGRVLLATLGRGTLHELKESFRTAAGQMGIRLAAERYGPPMTGAPELRDCLEQAGFREVKLKEQVKLEFYPCAREFLLSLKKRGSNNPSFRRMSLPVERTLLRKMIHLYDSRFRVDGRVYASYEVIFASGEKSPGGRGGVNDGA